MLLRALAPSDWEQPTVAGAWRVRDVAAHLLDGDLRKLAAHRDGHLLDPGRPIASYEDVVALIQHLNAGGVAFGARLSPRVLTDLLEVTGQWISTFVASLNPESPALFAVAWAGESRSDNRFDTAREYSERWHHQMQIRQAVGTNPDVLLTPKYFDPLVDTSVRVLPHAYRDVHASEGTSIVLQQSSEPPRSWTLRRESQAWRLYEGEGSDPSARVLATPDMLWRLFFNAIPVHDADRVLLIDGEPGLTAPLLHARSVMV